VKMKEKISLKQRFNKNRTEVRSSVLWVELILPLILYLGLVQKIGWLALLSGALITAGFLLLAIDD